MTDRPEHNACREVLVDWKRPPPIREHSLPDGVIPSCRAVCGVMVWNMLGSGFQATGPILVAHIAWLKHDPKGAVSSWRGVCDGWAETNREVAEQAWHALWAEWMRLDAKAAMRHWAQINGIDAEKERESMEVFRKAIKLGEGALN